MDRNFWNSFTQSFPTLGFNRISVFPTKSPELATLSKLFWSLELFCYIIATSLVGWNNVQQGGAYIAVLQSAIQSTSAVIHRKHFIHLFRLDAAKLFPIRLLIYVDGLPVNRIRSTEVRRFPHVDQQLIKTSFPFLVPRSKSVRKEFEKRSIEFQWFTIESRR